MANNNGNAKSEQHRAPVYIPFKTFITAIETLQQGMPGALDRSVWPSFSGIAQSQTLGAFKFLGLIDDKGGVQPILKRLVSTKGDDRKAVLREIIDKQYVEAIQLGEKNASFQQLLDLFRGYGVQGGTLEKAIRFFLDSCDYTGLKEKCSPLWAKAKKTMRRPSRKGEAPPKDERIEGTHDEVTQSSVRTVQLRSGGTLSFSLSADLMALSREDREWLFDLIDRLNTYGEPKQEQK